MIVNCKDGNHCVRVGAGHVDFVAGGSECYAGGVGTVRQWYAINQRISRRAYHEDRAQETIGRAGREGISNARCVDFVV